MENYSITKFVLTLDTENLKGKKGAELQSYIDEIVCPVILEHLTAKPKNGEVRGGVSCTADRGGVRCEGSIGGSIKF